MKWLIAFFLIITFYACKPENTGESKKVQEEMIEIPIFNCNASTKFGLSNNAIICFDSLKEDSRCPTGVMCPWTGVAAIHLSLKQNNQTIPFNLATLNAGTDYKRERTINGIRFRLLELNPYPSYSTPFPISDYKAKLLISY